MKFKQIQGGCCLMLLTLGLSACGDGGGGGVTVTSVQGKVSQGPVESALIFADHLNSGSASALDPGEIGTTTGADGKFTLNVPDNYGDYLLVSQGGHDTLSTDPNSVAMQMFAPPGAANVTPLTTLVALAPPAQQAALIAKIEATGVKFDVDISTSATPAALFLSKCIETAVATLGKAIDPTGTKLTAAQLQDVQQKALAGIAASAASSSTPSLLTSADLKDAIFAGITSGMQAIVAGNNGITVSSANIATIANAVSNMVTTIATSMGNATGNFSTKASDVISEDDKFKSIQGAIDTAVAINAGTAATVVTVVPTAPTVVLTSSSLTGIAINSPVKVVFSRAMDAATINVATFKVAGVTGSAVSYDSATRTATFTHAANFNFDTSYTVTLSNTIKDTGGLALVPATLTFRTVVRPLTGSTGSNGTGANF